jgi:protein ImuB
LPLLAEIGASQALLFPMRRLVQGLCLFLRLRGGGAQRLAWTLRHRDGAPTRFELGLLRPSRDPEQMLELLRGRIERLRLRAPVIEMTLEVSDWHRFVERNDDLFGSGTPDHGLIERLRARLGDTAVHGLAAVAEHRPELAWRRCDPGDGGEPLAIAARRPLWLLAVPQPLPIRDDRPSYGGPLRIAGIPERIETGWWDGRAVARDYYLAHNAAGERLWIYRDRRSGAWYLHGVFA